MTITYDQFFKALQLLVAIEPESETYGGDMDKYDEVMVPHVDDIDKAHATIRAYGEKIAPRGLSYMQGVLDLLLSQQKDEKSISIIQSKVNWHWDGCGDWLG